MKITAIHANKYNRDVFSIYIDGLHRLTLSNELVLELGAKTGQTISEETLLAWAKKASLSQAKAAAFNLLSQRMHSRKELEDKLKRKGFPEEAVSRAIERLDELRMLDDQAYAEALVRSKLNRKAVGAMKLKATLHRKGINRDIIDSTLNEVPLYAEELCQKAAEKKLASLKRESDPIKRRRKLGDYLYRQGFDWNTISLTLNRILDEEK
ncbi:MAG: regulatory protein RecX [Chlorobiales bacterium]|nr:regulatory protein RecX [Chlorobiales bacterium]